MIVLGKYGDSQKSYEIEVGTSPGDNSMWDSGVVESDNNWAVYKGKLLEEDEEYWVSPRVKDNNGVWSGWATRSFRTREPGTPWKLIGGTLAILIGVLSVIFYRKA